MNDTMSLLLATTILALGGVGLYMYKSPDEGQKGGEEYNEDSLFGSGSFWGSSNESDEPIEEEEELSFHEPKVRARNSSKTKRNRKSSGTKRRYY